MASTRTVLRAPRRGRRRDEAALDVDEVVDGFGVSFGFEEDEAVVRISESTRCVGIALS